MSNVCSECIGESFVKSKVVENDAIAFCDFCNSDNRPTIELDDLAEEVLQALESHFYMTSSEPEGVEVMLAKEGRWEQEGAPIQYVIMDLLNTSDEVSEEIRRYLSYNYDPAGEDALIDPCPFADDAHYEERRIDTYEFEETWASFRREILSRSRFFNPNAKSALEHLFNGIAVLKTRDDEPVIRDVGPNKLIVRARVANSFEALEGILKNLPASLGAPPSALARAGRMNAEGISVFYGATDLDTCFAEIRPPVGGAVVSGNFSPLRGLQVLDLTRLEEVFLQGSFFDSAYCESLSRVHFLKQLQQEMSSPVMPGTELRKYLPTQVVAEYLGHHPDMQLDGIMFASSQTETNSKDSHIPESGKNVVLFSDSCNLARYDLPRGAAIKVDVHADDPDEPTPPTINIWEVLPKEEAPEHEDSEYFLFPDAVVEAHSQHLAAEAEPSLELQMDSVSILQISGVSYQTSRIECHRYRHKEDDYGF
jgi:hypothetical protein